MGQQLELTFNEQTEKWEFIPTPTTQLQQETSGEVDLEMKGIFKGITNIDVAGIPLGAAAVGGALAFVVDTLMDKYLTQLEGSMGNFIAAWVLTNPLKKFVGADTAKYAAIFLVYEAIRDPIESAINKVINPEPANGTTTAQQQQLQQQKLNQYHQQNLGQRSALVGDYYAGALTRN